MFLESLFLKQVVPDKSQQFLNILQIENHQGLGEEEEGKVQRLWDGRAMDVGAARGRGRGGSIGKTPNPNILYPFH